MHDIFWLKAAVIVLIPIGLSLGICFFIFAYYYYRSIRGHDVQVQVTRIRLIIGVLFAAFVGVFALIQFILKG